MASGILDNVGIKGIACAVPDNIRRSEEYNEIFGEENVRKFVNMTGINTRRVALNEQCTSDLCYVAAKKLMDSIGWDPLTVDALILITQTPDYAVPATSCVLQYRLGLKEDCITFDVNLGCSAYVYGIWLSATIISTRNVNRVLLLVGDTSNYGINPDDSATAMIFGDGGTATALEREEGKSIKYFLKTKGSGFKYIIVPAGHARSRYRTDIKPSELALTMNGSDVFSFTITDVPRTIKSFMEEFNIDKKNIDLYVFHQANLFILKNLARKLGVPMEKLAVSIDRYGNTSGESIPLTLVDALGGREGKEIIRTEGKTPGVSEDIAEAGDPGEGGEKNNGELKAFLCGFGVGLSWGGIYLTLKKDVCLPMIYTNDYFTGG